VKHTNGPRVDLSHAAWRKSSYSGDQGNCVESAEGFRGVVPVPDSKTPAAPSLIFSSSAWVTFIAGTKPERLA
jgi:hypothetical protein